MVTGGAVQQPPPNLNWIAPFHPCTAFCCQFSLLGSLVLRPPLAQATGIQFCVGAPAFTSRARFFHPLHFRFWCSIGLDWTVVQVDDPKIMC
ncbi:hypothetical protein SLA2020_265030 [Shorea laevis]